MGMTIDKAIEFFDGLECHTPQAKDAREVAVDTMRKYQKIQELIAMDDENHRRTIRLADLKEVIEDGENNN